MNIITKQDSFHPGAFCTVVSETAARYIVTAATDGETTRANVTGDYSTSPKRYVDKQNVLLVNATAEDYAIYREAYALRDRTIKEVTLAVNAAYKATIEQLRAKK